MKRDLALLIDKKVQFAEIEKIAYETEKKLLKEVSLFDVYEGKNLEAGKKSYAVSFLLQDENATLNDKQIDKVMQKLIANLQNRLGPLFSLHRYPGQDLSFSDLVYDMNFILYI